jgi:predicted Na+-dependent transporter
MLLLLRHPDARRWEPALSRISVLVILVVVGIDGFDQPSPPTEEFSQSVAPVALYTLSAVLVGTLVPSILGISARDGATIALELVVKNTMLGIVLLTQVVDFVAIVPLLAYMIVQIPIGVGILVCWRLLAHHGFVAPLLSLDID